MIDAYNEYIQKLYDEAMNSEEKQKSEIERAKIVQKINDILHEIFDLEQKKKNLKGLKKILQEKAITKKIEKLKLQYKQLQDQSSAALINYKHILERKIDTGNFVVQRDYVKKAFEILEEKNIPFSLNETDINKCGDIYADAGKIYNDIDDFVCVHKTDYAPVGGILKSTGDATIKQETINIMGQSYTYTYQDNPRNTIHFALNGEVGDHEYGDWSNSKYAYIIPFTSLPLNKLAGFSTVDTYFKGSIELPPDAIFICPKEEEEEIRKNNPNLKIVTYIGKNNVSGFADFMVEVSGYNLECCTKWAWANDQSQNKAIKIAQSHNYKITAHAFSDEHEQERAYIIINKLIGIIEVIKQNNLLNNSTINVIKEDLLKQKIIDNNDNARMQEAIQYLYNAGYISEDAVQKIVDGGNFSEIIIDSLLNNMLNEKVQSMDRHK